MLGGERVGVKCAPRLDGAMLVSPREPRRLAYPGSPGGVERGAERGRELGQLPLGMARRHL